LDLEVGDRLGLLLRPNECVDLFHNGVLCARRDNWCWLNPETEPYFPVIDLMGGVLEVTWIKMFLPRLDTRPAGHFDAEHVARFRQKQREMKRGGGDIGILQAKKKKAKDDGLGVAELMLELEEEVLADEKARKEVELKAVEQPEQVGVSGAGVRSLFENENIDLVVDDAEKQRMLQKHIADAEQIFNNKKKTGASRPSAEFTTVRDSQPERGERERRPFHVDHQDSSVSSSFSMATDSSDERHDAEFAKKSGEGKLKPYFADHSDVYVRHRQATPPKSQREGFSPGKKMQVPGGFAQTAFNQPNLGVLPPHPGQGAQKRDKFDHGDESSSWSESD
jgi:hypothetical protein